MAESVEYHWSQSRARGMPSNFQERLLEVDAMALRQRIQTPTRADHPSFTPSAYLVRVLVFISVT